MTQRAVDQVRERVQTDPEFRQQLETDPRPALAPYDLNIAEMTTLMGLIASGALWAEPRAPGVGARDRKDGANPIP